ncbi:hypothetical protein LRS20_17555, partial [Klebsiella pneumoniae]|uniref:hypothetical protein n=1 Tax=Klebsiella pneumoniae TaxID=573 RepID=UPI0022AE7A33
MNKKESDEGSHDWEKARVAKELIRLEKQAAEKRARLKNKLKWLGKEPRASFFYFFFLALYFEKLRGQLGNDSNLLIVFYVQIMPDDLVMQLHR